MGQYSDIKQPPAKPFIVITRVLEPDQYAQAPDKMDDGFWPSLEDCDGDNAQYAQLKGEAELRMSRYEAGAWGFVGVRAKAVVTLPIGGNSVITYTLKSAGLWGVEDDSGEDYLNEVFADQAAELVEHIKLFAGAVENVTIEKE